jgi:HSP20 family protein
MQLDVGKWNPFRFLRRSSGERRNEPSRTGLAATGNMPAAWPDPLVAQPLRMMQDMMMRDPFSVMRDPLSGLGLEHWFGDFSPGTFQPRLDVVDDGDALRVIAELPGMDRKDVEIMIEDDAIVLRGEKKLESEIEEKGCYRVERAFGSFQRMIPLPDGVDVNGVEAKFDNGVLTLRLPKVTGEKPDIRRIEIK